MQGEDGNWAGVSLRVWRQMQGWSGSIAMLQQGQSKAWTRLKQARVRLGQEQEPDQDQAGSLGSLSLTHCQAAGEFLAK